MHRVSVMDVDVTVHSHCEKCYRISCSTKSQDGEKCPVIQCPLQCGAMYHACKQAEHSLLCKKEKVPCINASNGCPLQMPRSILGKHLEVCPASVVHCTMEWNRWPVYSVERNARIPFSNTKYHAKYGQLDVALALRDQRMLNAAMKAPRSTRRALRNKLTQRFPAVPIATKRSGLDLESSLLPESDVVAMASDDDTDSDAPWEARKQPPGLASSVCSELFKATKRTTESLSEALSLITGDQSENSKLCSIDENQENGEQLADSKESGSAVEEGGYINKLDRLESTGCQEESQDVVLMRHGNVHMTEEHVQAMAMPKAYYLPQPPPLLLEELLALDLNLESITRYQAKAKSMYTFLCAQCFRRDEYPWHFQNVHCDIHGGLNGWLEQRCPNAQYGCTYSYRRFYPSHQGANVVYSPLLESFGIKPNVPNCLSDFSSQPTSPDSDSCIYNHFKNHRDILSKQKSPTPEIYTSKDYSYAVHVNGTLHKLQDIKKHELTPPLHTDLLSMLPFEVLQHMARFLDGYSLCNLALTSRYLRDVCCSLLCERGIVVQEWEKADDKSKWSLTYQRWFFSTAFSPVMTWGMTDVPHMSEHLKVCPVYKPAVRMEPFKLHGTSPSMHDNPAFWRHLQAMYPTHNFQWSPTFIECLKEAESQMIENRKATKNKQQEFTCSNGNGDNNHTFSDF